MQFVKPMPFQEALDKIGAKTPIGSAMLSSEWLDVPVALRERAFFSSQVENIRFLQRGRDMIGDFLSGSKETLPDGQTALSAGSRAQFVDLMREFAVSEGMGPLDPDLEGTIKDITSEKRLGLVFNTVTQQADDYGFWRQGMDPDVLNEFPAQRFIRVKAVKQEREAHVPFENQVYLKTDPIWAKVINKDFGVPWGPWGWGCGHDVQDEDRDTAEQLGLIKAGERLEPDRKNFNENLKASAAGLDPDLIEKLKRDLGDQLVIEGDEMRWNQTGQTGKTGLTSPTPTLPEPAGGSGPTAALPLVSQALNLDGLPKSLKQQVKIALDAIDQVHDDGTLPRIPVVGKSSNNWAGKFRHSLGKAVDIWINRKGPWAALTAVHEAGHFLDLEAMGIKGSYATTQAVMKDFLAAADKTEAIKGLRKKLSEAASISERKTWKYFLKPQEIWARAYAQFVAEESADVQLGEDLAKALAATPFRQWETEDFAPIKAEITKLFKGMGWLK